MLALRGVSRPETAGLGGSFRLGKVAAQAGADMGGGAVNGLGGAMGAVAGGDSLLLAVDGVDVGEERSTLQEHSDGALVAVPVAEDGDVSPDTGAAGEFKAIALDRKSV